MPGLDCQAIGAIVIDLDAKNNGAPNFEALCREREIDLDDALCVRTPTGGVHYYFADPTGRWRNSTSKLGLGVDTRGVGGYVVAPGALRHGVGLYEPVRPTPLVEFIDIIASGRLAAPPKPLADLLDEYCLPGAGALRTDLMRRVGARANAVVMALPQSLPSRKRGSLSPQPTLTQSPLFDGQFCDWDALSAGVADSWTLEGALRLIAAAVPGTRNDTFARQAFTAGLRARDLGLDPDRTVDAFIEAAGMAGSDDAKTADTITRCFAAGMAHAEAEVAAMATARVPTPGQAATAPRGTQGWTLSHEAAALRSAKAHFHNVFVITQKLGRHRVRADLVRAARAISNVTVRARLMFTLAAYLTKSNCSPEEIVEAAIACGFPRETGVHAVLWARKNIARKDRSP
jgi:hypothetical protein